MSRSSPRTQWSVRVPDTAIRSAEIYAPPAAVELHAAPAPQTNPQTAPEAAARIAELDGLRALSIGVVVGVVTGVPDCVDRSVGAPPRRDDHDATLPPPYSRSTAMSLAEPSGGAFQVRSMVVSRLGGRSA